jgi:pimeloyl-ACP methyl ester carboxylesterase
VLEADLRLGVAIWGPVERALATDGRTCVVESTSDQSTESPRLLGDRAADHLQALAATDVPGPYLVVGHGDAAIVAQLLAHRFAGDVAGLVLVDPLPLDWFDRVRPLLDAESRARFDELVTDDPVTSVVAASMDELAGVVGLADLPFTVVAPDPADTGAESGNQAAAELLGQLQRELAQSSTNGELIIAGGGGPAMIREQPATIVEAIESALARIEGEGD